MITKSTTVERAATRASANLLGSLCDIDDETPPPRRDPPDACTIITLIRKWCKPHLRAYEWIVVACEQVTTQRSSSPNVGATAALRETTIHGEMRNAKSHEKIVEIDHKCFFALDTVESQSPHA